VAGSESKNWRDERKGVCTNHDAMILDELGFRVVLIGTAEVFWRRNGF
jgi:hypothetical protein